VELLGWTRIVGHHSVLVLDGVIDLSTLPILHDLLNRPDDRSTDTDLVVDLDGVEALDDCGLGVLLGAAGRYRERGRELMIVATSPRLRHRFDMTGLSRAVRVLSNVSEVARATDDPAAERP